MGSLKQFLAEKGWSEEDALKKLELIGNEPAEKIYVSITKAAEQFSLWVDEDELNLDNPKHDAIFKFLQAGDKIVKSLKLAKNEFFPTPTEVKKEEEKKNLFDN